MTRTNERIRCIAAKAAKAVKALKTPNPSKSPKAAHAANATNSIAALSACAQTAQSFTQRAVKCALSVVLCVGLMLPVSMPTSEAYASTDTNYESIKSYLLADYNHGTIEVTSSDADSSNVIELKVGETATITVSPYQHVQYTGCRMWNKCPTNCGAYYEDMGKEGSCFNVGYGCECDKTASLETADVTTTVADTSVATASSVSKSETLKATADYLGKTNKGTVTITAVAEGTTTVTVAVDGLYFWYGGTQTYTVKVVDGTEEVTGGDTITKGGTYKLKSYASYGVLYIATTEAVTLKGEGITTGKASYFTVQATVDSINLTIENLSIDNATEASYSALVFKGGSNTLTLSGQNSLRICYNSGDPQPVITVPSDATLTIDGDGELYSYSHTYGTSCIGSSDDDACGNIIVKGGILRLYSMNGGPCIGGYNASVTVEDGDLALFGGSSTGCIDGKIVSITGGTVSLGMASSGNQVYVTETASIAGGNVYASSSSALAKALTNQAAYTFTVDDPTATIAVTVDGASYYKGDLAYAWFTSSEPGSTPSSWTSYNASTFTVYMSKADHTVTVNDVEYKLEWNDVLGAFALRVDEVVSNISYVLNGGTNASDAVTTYVEGVGVSELPTPTREGYAFSGWVDASGTTVSAISAETTGEVVLYATWTPITYTINYVLDGGVNAPSNPTTYTVETAQTELVAPVLEGYTFTGWVDANNNPVTTVAGGAMGDITLYATWSINNYTVTLNAAGGTVEIETLSYTIKTQSTALPTPTRTGYAFAGWTTDAGSTVTTYGGGEVGDYTLTATWEVVSYTVTLDAAGGSLDSSSLSYTIETAETALPEPTREGYEFTGWQTSEGTAYTVYGGGMTGDIALVATWKAVETPSVEPEVISSETVDIAFVGTGDAESMSSMVSTMTQTYLGTTAQLVTYDDDTMALVITSTSSSFQKIVLGDGTVIELADDMTLTIPVEAESGTLDMTIYIGGNMASVFPNGITVQLSYGEEEGEEPDPDPDPDPDPITASADRLGGSNRYNTMALVSQAAFADGECSTVIVCRGDNFPDALAAASLAGVTDGQVLLTATKSLSSQTQSEIERLGASMVYIIGDTNSVSSAAEKSIKAISGVKSVKRLAGSNRYNTAIEIYNEGATLESGWGDICVVATGAKAADSLSVSSVAYGISAPIFLADKSGSLSSAALSAIKSGGFTKVLVLGDTNSVSAATAATLKGYSLEVVRLEGSNRYATSIAIADYAIEELGFSCAKVAVTAGNNGKYADALVASALCGKAKSPVLLVNSTATSAEDITNLLSTHSSEVETVYVLGSSASVTDALYSALEKAIS